MVPAQLDAALGAQPWFSMLRADERVRLGGRLPARRIEPAAPVELVPEAPVIALVVAGEVHLSGDRHEALFPGDAVGAVALCSGRGLRLTLSSPGATVLLIDRAAFDAMLADFPAVAPAFLAEVARELKWKSDLLREVSLAHAAGLSDQQLTKVLAGRRRRLDRLRRGLVGRATSSLLRRLVLDPAREPAFWTLLGFVLALSAARAVVGEIIHTGAQKHFFALIGGATGHPIHIHHFNYGIATVTLTGIAALHPRARRVLRLLAFTFGFGCGLVIDEFALLWNLNPDYYQAQSRVAMLVAGALLLQLVYLRAVYAQLGRRLWMRLVHRRDPS